jgi:LDH2 family malate/lactate/ureidoglycolate dehydrogenase
MSGMRADTNLTGTGVDMAHESSSAAHGTIDADTPETVRLSESEARVIGEGALQRIGYPAEEARIIVDQLIDNALCGYKFAGLPRILAIAGDQKTRKARTAMLDGGNNVGYIAAYRAAEVAIEKVRKMGIASVGAYNSYYSGRNAYFVEHIVREGYFAFHVASAQPHVLPPGGAAPAMGTNPICFGFPSTDGPVIVDMGTAPRPALA